jgi:hypothetical protein
MRRVLYRTTILGVLVLSAGAVIGQQAITRSDAGAEQSKKGNTKITALLTERRDLMREEEQLSLTRYRQGVGTLEELQRVSGATIHADLDLARTRAERIALLQQWVDKTHEYETLVQGRYNSGTTVQTDVLEARAAHLEAEIELERAKGSK